MPAIATHNLSKKFGEVAAVDGLNLTVPEGSVFGFLGPNGAGKTTTLKLLTGLARPTSGKMEFLGADIAGGGASVRTEAGYLPENPAFYSWMTAREYLNFCADLFKLPAPTRKARVGSLLEFSDLAGNEHRIDGYSRGMRQRLGLAQALINDPKVLLLDEPTSALDPVGRKEVLEMISGLEDDKTVVLSTHILSDVERVCDRVAVLNHGRLVLESDLRELKEKYMEPVIDIEVDGGADKLIDELRKLDWVSGIKGSGDLITLVSGDTHMACRELPKIIGRTDIGLRRFEVRETSLEDIFIKITE